MMMQKFNRMIAFRFQVSIVSFHPQSYPNSPLETPVKPYKTSVPF
jgi:hypothetical protein